jgi:hypothetical protein
MNNKRMMPVLIMGDWLALGLFVFLGQLEHELVVGYYSEYLAAVPSGLSVYVCTRQPL